MSVEEERNKLLKCLKYYNWMTEEEKNVIFCGMLQIFTTIKVVKRRATCDLIPKVEPRSKMMDTQEQYISAFNISQNVDDFGFEEDKEEKTEKSDDDIVDKEDDDEELGYDFSSMFKGFLNYVKSETIPIMEQSIDNASKVVNKSIKDVKSNTRQLYNQSIENISVISEHPLFIASLPMVSATIGSAVGGMIAGEEGKKAIAQSIGSSLGRVAGEQIAISLKDKKTKRSNIKEEENEDTPRILRRRN